VEATPVVASAGWLAEKRALGARVLDGDVSEKGLSRVTAIVVAHDSAAILPACLTALAAEGTRLIVVDNASRDDSADLAESLGAAVLRLPLNEGYGRANNVGIRAADTEFVLVCNPDAVPDPGSLAALVSAADAYPDAGLLAPRIVEPDGRFFFQPRSLLAPYLTNLGGTLALPEGDACAPFLSGACFLMRRDLALSLGGFDPAIFLFYEDDDLCRRIADSGHALIHVHGAIVRHARGTSSAPEPGRVFRSRWHQAWSRAYVSRKYGLPNPAPGMWAINAVKTALSALTFRRSLLERYGGSAAGAWAFLRGRTALEQQGLE
jgi:N-acetylglucosaminyl-diphospho-decaprenol L-rhamnosyltransferase